MEQHKLSLQPRLQMLADLVPQGALIADIGTDHGYLPVWLLQEGRISGAIASDINEKPLEHARQTAREYGLEHRLELRLCGGLEGYKPGEADTIIIAGMGGETIASILEAAAWTRESGIRLLLQPMTKAETLRIWLADKGYRFTEEHLVEDKDYLYPVFCVTGGERRTLSAEEAYGGLLLDNDPLWGRYLSQQLNKLQIRINGLTRSGKDTVRDEVDRLEKLYAALAARKEKLHEHGTGN